MHISDIHYKGDHTYLERIVASINRLAPDAVCFTGDIVENTNYLTEALNALGRIKAPLYGVPGNHEYWSGASFDEIGRCFGNRGGAWLMDRSVAALEGKLLIAGRSGTAINTHRAASEFAMPGRTMDWTPAPLPAPPISPGLAMTSSASGLHQENPSPAEPGVKRILLTHYPAEVDTLTEPAYDLVLSGHSHGGQVRLPWFGALIVPFGVNRYQMGTYATPSGRLHVSAGLGTFFLPVRFCCRPEITLIEL